MLENSFGLLFFLKQPKNHKNKLWYVFMRITINGKRKELSTKRLLDPRLWNADNGCANGIDKKAENLNVYLDAYREKVYQAKRLLIDMGKDLSAEGIKDILMGKGEERKMILAVFQLHNDQMRQLVGKEFAKGTLERYETSKEHTRSFIQWKYKVDDLDIKRLDHEFISQYSFWLKEFRNCGYNSAMKYLSNFKKIVLVCVKNKWLREDLFVHFKMSPKEMYKEPLSADELRTIIAKEFSINRPPSRYHEVIPLFPQKMGQMMISIICPIFSF